MQSNRKSKTKLTPLPYS